MYKRKIKIEDLFAEVEQEKWIYDDGHNYVCSSFVIAVYQRAGLFGDKIINATEFTPKDLIELNFWDLSGKNLPEVCKDVTVNNLC